MERHLNEIKTFSHFSVHTDLPIGEISYTPPHIHMEIEVLYGLQGICEAIVGDRTYRFGVGDMVVTNSLENHALNTIGDGVHQYAVLKFDPEFIFSADDQAGVSYSLYNLLRHPESKRFFSAEELADTEIPSLFLTSLEEDVSQAYGNELAIKNNVSRLFLWLLRHQHTRFSDDNYALDLQTRKKIKKVLDHIHENYASPISGHEMAEMSHFSYPYFSRIFHLVTGKCFCEYINSLRVDYAKELLASSHWNVTEVALAVGFSTSSYFIQQFRRFTGETPSQFQRKARTSHSG